MDYNKNASFHLNCKGRHRGILKMNHYTNVRILIITLAIIESDEMVERSKIINWGSLTVHRKTVNVYGIHNNIINIRIFEIE